MTAQDWGYALFAFCVTLTVVLAGIAVNYLAPMVGKAIGGPFG